MHSFVVHMGDQKFEDHNIDGNQDHGPKGHCVYRVRKAFQC